MKIKGIQDSIGVAIIYPLFVALLSAFICATGVWLFLQSSLEGTPAGKVARRKSDSELMIKMNSRNLILCLVASSIVTFMVFLWSNSIAITLPFTFFSAVVTWSLLRNRTARLANELLEVWPEVTDHLISALHSGMSLSEALVGLSTRGPVAVRPHFQIFKESLLSTGDFTNAVETLRDRFSSHGSDQIFEAIMLAKSLGGSELLQVFRTLGEFLRQDLAVRKEIEIKHSWIKNSAHLSSAAPWLLLLLLSSQPSTARAFSQPSGAAILLVGLVLTGVAYFWMGKLGKLPVAPRVFGGVR
jgi:tight adherence protein B